MMFAPNFVQLYFLNIFLKNSKKRGMETKPHVRFDEGEK